jgi:hypothetical protein
MNEWTSAATEVLKLASFSLTEPSKITNAKNFAHLCLKLGLQIAGQGAVLFSGIMWEIDQKTTKQQKDQGTTEQQRMYQSKEALQEYAQRMASDTLSKFTVTAQSQGLAFLLLRYAFAAHSGGNPDADTLVRSMQQHVSGPLRNPRSLCEILGRTDNAHSLLPSLSKLTVCYAHAFDNAPPSEEQIVLRAMSALMYILIWAKFSVHHTLDDPASDDALCAMFLNIVAQSTETSLSNGTASDKEFLKILQEVPTPPIATFAPAQAAVVSAHTVENDETVASMAATIAAIYVQANGLQAKRSAHPGPVQSAAASALALANAVSDATDKITGRNNEPTLPGMIIDKAVSTFKEGGYAMKAVVVATTPVWMLAAYAAFIGGAAVILVAVAAVILIGVCWLVYVVGKEAVSIAVEAGTAAVEKIQGLVRAAKKLGNGLARLVGLTTTTTTASAAPHLLTTLRLLHARTDALLLTPC